MITGVGELEVKSLLVYDNTIKGIRVLVTPIDETDSSERVESSKPTLEGEFESGNLSYLSRLENYMVYDIEEEQPHVLSNGRYYVDIAIESIFSYIQPYFLDMYDHEPLISYADELITQFELAYPDSLIEDMSDNEQICLGVIESIKDDLPVIMTTNLYKEARSESPVIRVVLVDRTLGNRKILNVRAKSLPKAIEEVKEYYSGFNDVAQEDILVVKTSILISEQLFYELELGIDSGT